MGAREAAAAFDPATGAWTDLARCPVPAWPDLTNASLAWTGRQLIVVTWDNESYGTPQVEVLSSPVQNSKSGTGVNAHVVTPLAAR